MDLQLQNKTALVTGATAGIGLAIAQELAREGAAVTITGREQDKIKRALHTIGNGAKGSVADLSDRSGTNTLFAQLPRVDILVNNLGIYEPKQFADIADEDWLRLFQLNCDERCAPFPLLPTGHAAFGSFQTRRNRRS